MRRSTTLAAALAVACVVVAGCTGSADGTGGAATGSLPPDQESPLVTALPSRINGPQGRTGQFIAKCGFSHRGPNDPIVHYDMPGMSHSHDFFGNEVTDASTTTKDLQSGPTTCGKQSDRASYWAPTLSDRGTPVTPDGLVAYYRPAPGTDPKDVEPYPAGLKMVSGNATATEPQPVERAGWTCGASSKLSPAPPAECPGSAPLHLVVTFPDCWDGKATDSSDHQRHVAASTGGKCPASHPVHVPQLMLSISYPVSGPGHDLSLASGSIYSAHADFFNGWRPEDLEQEVRLCLHNGVVCGVASNRAEEPLFQSTYD